MAASYFYNLYTWLWPEPVKQGTESSFLTEYCDKCKENGFTNIIYEKYRYRHISMGGRLSFIHCSRCDFCHPKDLKECEQCGYCRSSGSGSGKCNGHYCDICNISSKPGLPYVHCTDCNICHLTGVSKCLECGNCCSKLRKASIKCRSCSHVGSLYVHKMEAGPLCGICTIKNNIQQMCQCGNYMVLTRPQDK